jgi:hypothetical protein
MDITTFKKHEDRLTIVVVPLLVEEVLRSGCVMTASKPTEVIVDSEQIISEILALREADFARQV